MEMTTDNNWSDIVHKSTAPHSGPCHALLGIWMKNFCHYWIHKLLHQYMCPSKDISQFQIVVIPRIKKCIEEKPKAFKEKNWTKLKLADCNLKKMRWKNEEEWFPNVNTKLAFHKVQTLTGYESWIQNYYTCNNRLSAICEWTKRILLMWIFQVNLGKFRRTLPLLKRVELPPFTVEDVRRQLGRCKLAKAPCPDGISAGVLKNCAQDLSPIFLLTFFSEAYLTATIWKMSSSYIPYCWEVTTHGTRPLPHCCPHIHKYEMPEEAVSENCPASCQP